MEGDGGRGGNLPKSPPPPRLPTPPNRAHVLRSACRRSTNPRDIHFVGSTTENLHRRRCLFYNYVRVIRPSFPFPCHRRQVVELWGDGPTVEKAAEAVRAFPEERKELYFVEDVSWSISVRKEVFFFSTSLFATAVSLVCAACEERRSVPPTAVVLYDW